MKIVIGSKTCSKCQQLKEELEKNKEMFEYKDIKDIPYETLSELSNKFGTQLPIVYEE